jgi:hypothetical protein
MSEPDIHPIDLVDKNGYRYKADLYIEKSHLEYILGSSFLPSRVLGLKIDFEKPPR